MSDLGPILFNNVYIIFALAFSFPFEVAPSPKHAEQWYVLRHYLHLKQFELLYFVVFAVVLIELHLIHPIVVELRTDNSVIYQNLSKRFDSTNIAEIFVVTFLQISSVLPFQDKFWSIFIPKVLHS